MLLFSVDDNVLFDSYRYCYCLLISKDDHFDDDFRVMMEQMTYCSLCSVVGGTSMMMMMDYYCYCCCCCFCCDGDEMKSHR